MITWCLIRFDVSLDGGRQALPWPRLKMDVKTGIVDAAVVVEVVVRRGRSNYSSIDDQGFF